MIGKLIEFECFEDVRGLLTVVEDHELMFDMRRVYFVHDVPHGTMRGDHAHYRTKQLLIAIRGTIQIECSDGRKTETFLLDRPNKGLYVPEGVWVKSRYEQDATLCVIASLPYSDRDYITDYKIFKKWNNKQPFSGVHSDFTTTPDSECFNSVDWSTEQSNRELSEPPIELLRILTNGMVVLDWGGSVGGIYWNIMKRRPDLSAIEYHIVEVPAIVKVGAELSKKLSKENDTPKLFFHDTIPEFEVLDVLFSGSSIQYAEDWRILLEDMVAYEPEYIILLDTPVGKIKTFATVQNWYGHFIPVWFININELMGELTDYNIMTGGPGTTINTNNLPKGKRLEHTCNLVLKRKS